MSEAFRALAEHVRRGAEQVISDSRQAIARGEGAKARPLLEAVAETKMVPDSLRADAAKLLAQVSGDDCIVSRDNDSPLRFRGITLAKGDSKWPGKRGDPERWHEATIYLTSGGAYVVSAALRTVWRGEMDACYAWVCDSPNSVIRTLRECDPIPSGIGYPPGDHYSQKQQRLVDDLRGRWGRLIGQLLAKCRFVETVE